MSTVNELVVSYLAAYLGGTDFFAISRGRVESVVGFTDAVPAAP